MAFLNGQNILYKKQFDFKKNSTADTIIILIDSTEKVMNNNLFVCGIFIDLKKAFETIEHKTLIRKLSYYGIRDLANSRFSSYLSKGQSINYVRNKNSKF